MAPGAGEPTESDGPSDGTAPPDTGRPAGDNTPADAVGAGSADEGPARSGTTGRASVDPHRHGSADDSDRTVDLVVRRGWRHRPLRWLGLLAALVTMGSLAVGVAWAWLTRGPGRPPAEAGPSSGATPTDGAPPVGP
ncbi:MAG: hypothetical protein WCA46_11885, partial [Actinocatenispora sp.]